MICGWFNWENNRALPLELCLKETLAKICLRLSGNDVANIRWCKEAKYIKPPTMGWWQESPPLISHSSSFFTYDMIAVIQSSDLNETSNYFLDSLYQKIYKVDDDFWASPLLRNNLFVARPALQAPPACGSTSRTTTNKELPLNTANTRRPGGPGPDGVSLMVSGCLNSSWLFHFFPKVSDFFEGSWKKRKDTWWFESVRDVDVGCHNMEPNVIEVLVH